MTAHLLLAVLFLLTIGNLVTLKVCSVNLDHRTAPVFIGGWTMAGLLATFPVFGHLLIEGIGKYMAEPWMLILAAVKGALLYVLLIISQKLMKESLSSRHYVTPLAVGLIAVVNHLLGERLSVAQWISAIGLCALSAGFFFKGHLSDLSRQGRVVYAQLVAITVVLAAIDHTVIHDINWYALLFASNVVIIGMGLAHNARRIDVLKAALLTRPAAMAGFFYAATELVKFYQQVTINPVTAVVTVQAATKPVILLLSALVWKERTVKEQMAWGLAAFALVMVPMLF